MDEVGSVRWTGLLTIFVCSLGGCDRFRAEAPPAVGEAGTAVEVGAPDDDPARDSLASLVEAVHRPALGEVEARLAKVLSVKRLASVPTDPVTWKAPSCPLRYRFGADFKLAALEGEPPVAVGGEGARIAGDVTMVAGPDDLAVIRNGDLEISQVNGGLKRPGSPQPAGSLAEVRLRRDGAQWSEVDGPTTLWSAYGSFPGLVEFWPALPPAAAPGSSSPWALTVHSRGDGVRVETTRGTFEVPEGTALPEPSPHTYDAEVELQGWLSVGGQSTAVLVATWTYDSKLDPPDPTSAAGDMDVDYTMDATSRAVVLDNGRLLWASVDRTVHASYKMRARAEPMRQRHDIHATIQLVDACDGPVLDTPVAEPSVEEATLAAIAELRLAAFEGDAERVIDQLAPEVVAAHGAKATVAALRKHVAKHGAAALGLVEIADDIQHVGDRMTVRLEGYSQDLDDDASVSTVFVVELRGGRPVILSIGTDTVERDEGWRMLEVSADRLVSGDVK